MERFRCPKTLPSLPATSCLLASGTFFGYESWRSGLLKYSCVQSAVRTRGNENRVRVGGGSPAQPPTLNTRCISRTKWVRESLVRPVYRWGQMKFWPWT